MEKILKLSLKVSLIFICFSLHAEIEGNNIPLEEDIGAISEALIVPDELIEPSPEEYIEPQLTDAISVDSEAVVTEVINEVEEAVVEQLTDSVEEALFTDAESLNESDGTLIKDVVLVLDNSGSMKKNDPNFLVKDAVKEFISQQDENTQVAVVIFDQDVNLSVPLTQASISNRESILNSIENINYKGLFTDSPAGIERAIYELKNNGRADAQKSIIFMTDGIVDTGAPEKDLEKSKWLREDLAADAADNDIKIFGIAFTENADFQLIQSISQKTDGEYYRALTVDDIQSKFGQIAEIINTPPEPEPIVTNEEVVQPIIVEQPVVVAEPSPPPAPVIIEVPAQSMRQEERIRSIIMIVAAIVLVLTLIGILILLLRRNKELKANTDAVAQEAYINDLQGKTDKETHKLSTKPTMFGRVAGKDTEHLDYIFVNESTIGRRHALIEFKDYSYWIIDQGSINGTFVNGQAVTSEVRLKHGDRIRLHKCDFEFIMPEMEDSGMTQISNTVFAGQAAEIGEIEEATVVRDHDGSEDATEIKSGVESTFEDIVSADSKMDFDITGTADTSETDIVNEDKNDPELPPDGDDIEESIDDETIMLEEDSDETIMLDDEFSDEEDATLRKDDN